MARPTHDDGLMLATVAELVVWRGARLEEAYRTAAARQWGDEGSGTRRHAAVARLRKKYPLRRARLERAARERRARELARWRRDGWPPPVPDLGTILGDAGLVGFGPLAGSLWRLRREVDSLIADLGPALESRVEAARKLVTAAEQVLGKTLR